MAQVTIPQALELATAHHSAGRLAEAESIYRQILAAQPGNADALQLLGVVALQSGKFDSAAELIGRAIAIQPDSAIYYCNLGQALMASAKVEPAIAAYRRALELQPDLADAHNSLGNAQLAIRQTDEAIASYRRAIAFRPVFAEAHNNLGNALASIGQHDSAIATFQQSLALRPDLVDALSNLANSLYAKGQLNDAMASLHRALALRPNHPDAHNNLGNVLRAAGRLEEAAASYRKAIELRPNFADAHSNLGNVLQEMGQFEQAIAEFHQALTIQPSFAECYNNLGNALKAAGRLDEAISAFHKALQIRPDFYDASTNLGAAYHAAARLDEAAESFRQSIALKPDRAIAHVNLGIVQLLQGQFKQGWPEYEWRWKGGELRYPHEKSNKPLWDGSELNGRRILIESEQGFGDTIQFARFLPMVAQRGGKVTLACPAELTILLQANYPEIQIVPHSQSPQDFDVHCPLLTLARIFDVNLNYIPSTTPYLKADREKSALWRERMIEFANKFKIGLAWAGRADHAGDRNRSIPPSALSPLGGLAEARFISLQKSPTSAVKLTPELQLTDWTQDLTDFSDTAALIDNLDCVITVDTAVAHLAGAMEKPVWILLPFVPDWRWMLNRDDSPWYQTARLFRQRTPGDWFWPLQEIERRLRQLSQTGL